MTQDATLSSGLTTDEAARRRAKHGPNEIKRERATSPWEIFARQFKSPVIWLLLGACILSGALGEVADAVAIGSIVVVNSLVGFFQEFRAERAVLALRSMTAPRARVLRDGRTTEVAATEVVPGDVLLLEAGDVVAADARLIEANILTTNEAPLTGESAPVEKLVAMVAPEAPLGLVGRGRSDAREMCRRNGWCRSDQLGDGGTWTSSSRGCNRRRPLSLTDCLLSLGLGLVPVSVLELTKLVRRILPDCRVVHP